MPTISRTLPPTLREAMTKVRTSLAEKVIRTEQYARQKTLAYGLASGTLPHLRIGNYDAVELVSGPLADIYLGREVMSGQFVALKGPNEFSGNQLVDHEANMLQQLQFEGIVKYLGTAVGPHTAFISDPHYLVEEYIFGVPASNLNLDYPEKIHVMLGAVNTLSAIHRTGLTHQNHWQGNMLISDSGTLTCVDFNCCYILSDFVKPADFQASKKSDQFWLAKRMTPMFGPEEQAHPIAQLLNTIGREVKMGEPSPYPFNTCDEFLDAIYAELQKTA
jgi:serine/threonine protein kinase